MVRTGFAPTNTRRDLHILQGKADGIVVDGEVRTLWAGDFIQILSSARSTTSTTLHEPIVMVFNLALSRRVSTSVEVENPTY